MNASTATTTTITIGNKTATSITSEFTENGRYSPLSVQDAVVRALTAVSQLPTKRFRAAARHGLQLFIIQTTFVITGIRSAYLLDTLILDRLALGRFLEVLDDHVASKVAVCYDETTDQTFIFNPVLLEARIKSEDFPLWVPTTPPFSLVKEPPWLGLLLARIDMKPGGITILQSNTPLDMIPFAAFLLEYPAGYVVTDPSVAFLSNVTLEVYEVSQQMNDTKTQILKFSVPLSCACDDFTESLLQKFQSRLSSYDNWGEVSVTRTMNVFDRVAL